jgi:hypothetical protein
VLLECCKNGRAESGAPDLLNGSLIMGVLLGLADATLKLEVSEVELSQSTPASDHCTGIVGY